MNITIFGATGRTGTYLLEKAVEKGHRVTVYVRNPQKLKLSLDKIEVIQGEFDDAARVAEAVKPADIVISTLGPVKKSPPRLMSAFAEEITQAMKEYDVNRLVWMTGAGVQLEGDQKSIIRSIVRGIMMLTVPSVLKDSEEAAQLIARTPLEWTIARVPILSDNPGQGNLKVSESPSKPAAVSREDIAQFLLQEAEDGKWKRKAPFLGL